MAETTQQLVSRVKEFVGHINTEAVYTLKHTVSLLNNRVQLLVDEVLYNVWLAASWNRQPRYHQLLQLLLINEISFVCMHQLFQSVSQSTNQSQQVRMYYASGTGGRCCICAGQMPHVHLSDGSTFQCDTT